MSNIFYTQPDRLHSIPKHKIDAAHMLYRDDFLEVSRRRAAPCRSRETETQAETHKRICVWCMHMCASSFVETNDNKPQHLRYMVIHLFITPPLYTYPPMYIRCYINVID